MACCASPANERLDALPSQWLHAHRHRLRRWQPVGIVIPWCKVTNIVDVAEHEGHGAETSKTAPSSTYRVRHTRQQSFHFIAFYSSSLRTVLVDPSFPPVSAQQVISDCHTGEKLPFFILVYILSSWITMCILWRQQILVCNPHPHLRNLQDCCVFREPTHRRSSYNMFPLKDRAHRLSHPNPGHVLSHFLAHREERIHHIFLMFPVDIGVYPWSGCAEL